MIPVGEDIQIVVPHTAIRSRAHLHYRCARAVLAEHVIADTDPRLRHLKPGWQDRRDGAGDGRAAATLITNRAAFSRNSVRLLG